MENINQRYAYYADNGMYSYRGSISQIFHSSTRWLGQKECLFFCQVWLLLSSFAVILDQYYSALPLMALLDVR